MKPWNDRPAEIRRLFNPAFCGLVICRSIEGYQEVNANGMPFSLSLLILPLCLNRESRDVVYEQQRTNFFKVVETSPEILIGLAERCRELMPITMESLGFIHHVRCMEVTENGHLRIEPKKVKKAIGGTQETIKIQRTSRVIGKKFAEIADRVSTYTLLGLRP